MIRGSGGGSCHSRAVDAFSPFGFTGGRGGGGGGCLCLLLIDDFAVYEAPIKRVVFVQAVQVTHFWGLAHAPVELRGAYPDDIRCRKRRGSKSSNRLLISVECREKGPMDWSMTKKCTGAEPSESARTAVT